MLSSELILSVPFNCYASNGVRRLIEDFRDMVSFCIDYALERRVASYDKLRKSVYEGVEEGLGLLNALLSFSVGVALAMLKGYRLGLKDDVHIKLHNRTHLS